MRITAHVLILPEAANRNPILSVLPTFSSSAVRVRRVQIHGSPNESL